jgi:hypothetical protein
MEGNFSYLEDLLTNVFKTWSASSTAISKDSFYYCDPAAADQGATANTRSIKSIVDAIGATKKAIIYLPHLAADGNTTTYTVSTSVTATDNFTLIVENGVIIAGAGTLTVNGTIVNLGALTITGTVTIAATGYLMDLGPITETGTLNDGGFRLTDAVTGSYTGSVVITRQLAAWGEQLVSSGGDYTNPLDAIYIPQDLNGMNLVRAVVNVGKPNTTGAFGIYIARKRSTTTSEIAFLAVDAGEYTSVTGASTTAIDTSYDDMQTGDLILMRSLNASSNDCCIITITFVFQNP